MAAPIILPKFDMTMEQGTIARWLRREGDRVEKGEPILEVETDKVTMEVESPASGILAGIRAEPGQPVPVAQVIAYVVQPGEEVPPAAPEPSPPDAGAAPVVQASRAASGTGAPSVAAAPAVRRLAAELGVDLGRVAGTGPGGRVTEADVRAAGPPQPAGLEGRRAVIARRVAQSAREIPHIHLTRSVDMTAAAAARGEASFTAVVVWAAARALRAHPAMRAWFQGGVVTVGEEVHVGVAVDAQEGLIVPVVRHADRKDLGTLHVEIDALARRARDNTLTLPEVTGAVFTVSNLGMWGIDAFTSLINPPQTAILSVGAVHRRPWVVGDDVVARPVCALTLAVDHRVADGAAGARYLDDVCRELEDMGAADAGHR
jgi:pyruvate dehydrogenase E2 component (dihydrolipoamide acetyltransferase)